MGILNAARRIEGVLCSRIGIGIPFLDRGGRGDACGLDARCSGVLFGKEANEVVSTDGFVTILDVHITIS
jgi:hypothetical protein